MGDNLSSRPDRRALLGVGVLGVGAAALSVAAHHLDGSRPEPVSTSSPAVRRGAAASGPPPPGTLPPGGSVRVFDVTDFGAIGDGSTDNVRAFQAAQIAVRANRGGIIYLPPGNYVSTPLPEDDDAYPTISRHLYDRYTPIRGPYEMGASHEVFALHTSNTTLLFAPGARLHHPPFALTEDGLAPAHTFIAIGGASNICVLGGELVGGEPHADRHDVIGIWLRNAEGVQIRGTQITGMRSDGIRVDEYHRWSQTDPPDPQASHRVVVTGCRIVGCRKQSILLRGARNVSIVGNRLEASGGHNDHIASVDFEDHDVDGSEMMLVEDHRFVGNLVTDSVADGIMVSGRNPQPGIVIAGNQLLRNGGDGLLAGQVAVVFGNRSEQNLDAGVTLAGSRAVDQVIVGNTLSGNGSYGLRHAVSRRAPDRSDKDQRDNVVVGNRVARNGAGPIQPDLASFDHDLIERTMLGGVVTTNLVADNLEVP